MHGKVVGISLLLLAFAPAYGAGPRAAVVELQNAADEFLPGLANFSEEALAELLREEEGIELVSREAVAQQLIKGKISVTRLQHDPELAAQLGKLLKARYLISGEVVDYDQNSERQEMAVELVVFDAAVGRFIFRTTFVESAHTTEPRKIHRELMGTLFLKAKAEVLFALGVASKPIPLAEPSAPPPSVRAEADLRVESPSVARGVSPRTSIPGQVGSPVGALQQTRITDSATGEASAPKLLTQALRLSKAGLPWSARSYFAKAMAAARQVGDVVTVAEAHAGLCRDRRFAPALAHCWSALTIFKTEGNLRSQAAVRIDLGKDYLDLGLAQEAIEEAGEAEKLARQAGDLALSMSAIEVQGRALVLEGRVEPGRELIRKVLEHRIENEDSLAGKITSRLRLAQMDSNLGRLESAANQLQRAVDLLDSVAAEAVDLESIVRSIEETGQVANVQVLLPDPATVAADARQTAEFDLPFGTYGQTVLPLDEEFLQQLEKAYELVRERSGRGLASMSLDVSSRQAMAVIESQDERFAQILSSMDTLSPMNFLSTYPQDAICIRFQRSEVEVELAKVLELLHQAKRASELRSLAWNSWDRSSGIAIKASSRAFFDSTIRKYLQIGMLTPEKRETFEKTQLSRYEELVDYSRVKLAGLPPPPSIADSMCGFPEDRYQEGWLKAEAERLGGDRAKAIKSLDTLVRRPLDPHQRIKVMASLARAYKGQGDFSAAIDTYQKTLGLSESLLGDLRDQPIDFASLQRPIYGELITLLADGGKFSEAFEVSERARAYDLHSRLIGATPESRGFTGADYLELHSLEQRIADLQYSSEVQQNYARGGMDFPGPSANLLAGLKQHRELLHERLKKSRPYAAAGLGFEVVSAGRLQEEVLRGSLSLVSFFVTDVETFAWVVTGDRVNLLRLPVGSAELKGRVNLLRDWIGQRDFDRSVAASLHVSLIQPVLPYLAGREAVVIPHGPLHELPFAALWSADRGRFAFEDFDLSLAPSATSLLYLSAKNSPFSGKVLVVGPPDDSLPSAAAEARTVASIFGATPSLGDEAARSTFRTQAEVAEILHLATHGFYDPEDPAKSYLQLAPPGISGRLSVSEVLGINLKSTKLAVLSACDTAAGRLSDGDDLVGLTRAFLVAGAASVVTTLWPVDDEASAALMTAFYAELSQPGRDLAEALGKAQREVAQREPWNSPYYWAGFVLTGDRRGLGASGQSGGS